MSMNDTLYIAAAMVDVRGDTQQSITITTTSEWQQERCRLPKRSQRDNSQVWICDDIERKILGMDILL